MGLETSIAMGWGAVAVGGMGSYAVANALTRKDDIKALPMVAAAVGGSAGFIGGVVGMSSVLKGGDWRAAVRAMVATGAIGAVACGAASGLLAAHLLD